jgi:pectate lyase
MMSIVFCQPMRGLQFFLSAVASCLFVALAHSVEPGRGGAIVGWATTRGGRGGEILRVTTLSAEGKGSFAAALRAHGPRNIVFEVGGVIDLGGHVLTINEPFVTIAGQTAPSPGITFIRGGINIATHDAIIKHIRVRTGEAGHAAKSGWEVDGMGTVAGSNVIVDHCSCAWATDENLSASGPRFDGGETEEEWRAHTSHHVTFSNCIIAEGLSHSTHGKGEHSKGSLLHDNCTKLTIVGNLYASNMERSPLAKGGVEAFIANNWISNPGRRAIHYSLVESEWTGHKFATGRLSIVGNVLEHGPSTGPEVPLFFVHSSNPLKPSPLEVFIDDNLAFNRERQPVPLIGGVSALLVTPRPEFPLGLALLPASQVKAHVAKHAGARPWDRDEIDQRIVRQALEGSGRIIDHESDVGGYPVVKETRQAFDATEWNLDTMERKSPSTGR